MPSRSQPTQSWSTSAYVRVFSQPPALCGPAPYVIVSALIRMVGRIADESFAHAAPRVARGVALHDFARVGTSWHRVDVFTNPIHDGAGKLAGLVVFLVDVSNDPVPTQTSMANDPGTRERARPV